jgi:hypothetical protein
LLKPAGAASVFTLDPAFTALESFPGTYVLSRIFGAGFILKLLKITADRDPGLQPATIPFTPLRAML